MPNLNLRIVGICLGAALLAPLADAETLKKKKAPAAAVDPDAARASAAPKPKTPASAPNAADAGRAPAPATAPTAVPAGTDVQSIDLGACTRNYSCALKGGKFGKLKAVASQKKNEYKAGEAIDATYSKMPDLDGNWITLVPAGQEDNSWCSWQWATGASGTQFYSGLPKGNYEVRLYYNWSGDGQCEVIGRKKFSVK